MKIWYVHGQYKASGLGTNRISYNIFDLGQVMKVAAHLQKDLFSLIADNFWLFFLNKWDFGIIPLIFTTLRKKIGPDIISPFVKVNKSFFEKYE